MRADTCASSSQAETRESCVLNIMAKIKAMGTWSDWNAWGLLFPRIQRSVGQSVQWVNDVRKAPLCHPCGQQTCSRSQGWVYGTCQEPNWEAPLGQNCLGSSDSFSAPGSLFYRSCAWWSPFSSKAWVTDVVFEMFSPPFSLKHQQIVNSWWGRRAKRIGYGSGDVPKLLESLCYWDLSISSSCVWSETKSATVFRHCEKPWNEKTVLKHFRQTPLPCAQLLVLLSAGRKRYIPFESI